MPHAMAVIWPDMSHRREKQSIAEFNASDYVDYVVYLRHYT